MQSNLIKQDYLLTKITIVTAMKSAKNFRKNSNDKLYSDESKKHKKPNSPKRHHIEDFDDDEDDINFDFKERESIEDYFDDDDD